MSALQLGDNQSSYKALIEAYREPQRHYHTTRHVDACLQHLQAVRQHLHKPAEVELALWFHDAVYEPTSSRNERDSADWAMRFLRENKAAEAVVERVEALIMATVHNAQPSSGDAAWLVDIDLTILGTEQTTYDAFEQAVRREYAWVEEDLYRQKRAEVLQGFLNQQAIYQTPHFHAKFEATARQNLQRAIAILK